MPDRLHLSARHRRVLEALLREHLPDVEVWAYGSRVNGLGHAGSDLDLVLRGPGLEKIPLDRLWEFEEAVRESTIPFVVEAWDWASLPQRFHREIERRYVAVGRRGGLESFSDNDVEWRQIGEIDDGSPVPSTTRAAVYPCKLTVPPLSEQRAIAHILGTLDDKIALNRRINETLEAMARALFKSWFVDFDPVRAKMAGRDTGLPQDIADLFPDRLADSEMGEIPEGWQQGRLNDLARLNPESWSSRNAPRRIRYVDLANTKWGSINDIQEFTWDDAPSRGRRVLRRGDTIVGTVRPRNGSFALIDRDGLTGSTAFAVLRPVTPTEREFVWCAATSEEAIERLGHLADGGVYPAVRPTAVLDTAVALPDPPIRLAFSSLVEPLVSRMGATQRESCTLAALRDTLLPKLISGEIRVTEAAQPKEAIS